MSVLGGVPHCGSGPASGVHVDHESWEEFFEEIHRKSLDLEWERSKQDGADKVNPSHYIGHNGIECHQVQRAVLGQAGMGAYWHGCAIKYVFRAIRKNGAEDIKKAIRCLQFWLDEVVPNESQREKLS